MADNSLPLRLDNEDFMEDVTLTNEEVDDLFNDDQDTSQRPLDYETFLPGFSDDESGEATFDRSWTPQKAGKASPKNKKSPRRSEDSDGDDETSPRTKRPRHSLFGGPYEEVLHQEQEAVEQNEDMSVLETPRPDIRQRFSSLTLDQQDAQDVHDTEGIQEAQGVDDFNMGFDLESSDMTSMPNAPSRAPSEESIVIPPDIAPAYKLRQNIDRAKASTYIDTDKTGNYDPAEEAKLKAAQLQKAKAAKTAKKKSKGKSKGKEKAEPMMKRIVKLRFEAYGNVRNYIEDVDNWPDNWSDIDSETEEELREIRDFFRRRTPDIEIQSQIEDPRGLVDDLTGHPAARGCKHCRELEHDCSMIEGGTFPCDQCEDDEEECTPIFKPHVKGPCQQCIADGNEACSFLDNPEESICERCAEYEHVCNTLPPKEYKTPRISIDEIMYGPNRKHITCTICRIEKKKCSLKKKTDKPPCKNCKKHAIGCTFYDLPAPPKEQTAAGKKKKTLGPTEGIVPEVSKPSSEFFSPEDLADMDWDNEEEAISREPTPEAEMDDEAGNKGVITKIKTSIAHPLQINITTDRSEECNYCGFPVFGFVGYFEQEVHVLRWHNGLGYTELGGGHCQHKGPTNMCAACTNSRLQVIICPGHEYERMSDDETPEYFAVAGELLDAEPGSAELRYQLQRWCSMCFSVATWGCSTAQPSLLSDDDAEIVGCGLRFCDKCYETLRDVYFGDLENFVDAMAKMPKTSEDDEQTGELEGKPRADVDLLRQNGLLMMIINASEHMQ